MTPANEHYARDLQALVLSMPAAQTLQLRFTRIAPGEVELTLPYQESLSFRPGQLQATPIFAAADFAAMAAAGSLLPAGWVNATIDCTLKIVGPANGSSLVARGSVLKAAKLLTVAQAQVYACRDGQETLCATMLATARNMELPQAQPRAA
ncbi:PaaI family thioesterase [Comamonas composti]|uniref:PaaI family thioesterase n=1 Tax=Comamonas composti TaxID=408558 RepID=UPI00042203D3|nr:PaaI family thioesterase [Comamonas composti]